MSGMVGTPCSRRRIRPSPLTRWARTASMVGMPSSCRRPSPLVSSKASSSTSPARAMPPRSSPAVWENCIPASPAHSSANVRFSTGSKGSLRSGVVKHRVACPCRREDGHLPSPAGDGPRTRVPSSGGNHEYGTGLHGVRRIRQSPASARRKVPWSTGVLTAIPPRPSGRSSRCSNPDSASRPCHSQRVRVLAGKRLVTNNFYPGTTVPTPPCKPVSVPC